METKRSQAEIERVLFSLKLDFVERVAEETESSISLVFTFVNIMIG